MRYTLPKIICSFFILQLIVLSFCTAQTITSFTPTSGPVGTLVTINGTDLDLNSPTNIKIGGVNAIEISNTGTELVAMVMPNATTGAVVMGNVKSNTNYTLIPNTLPTKQEGSKLVCSGFKGTYFASGSSVAISADGNTAIMGIRDDNFGNGAAWIFVRQNGLWVQQGNKLSEAPYKINNQGFCVAISADGNTVVLSGEAGNETSSTWVYRKINGIWSKLDRGFNSCRSLSLSADGNTLLLNNTGVKKSILYKYNAIFQAWELVKTFDFYGIINNPEPSTCSISADGNTVIFGCPSTSDYKGGCLIYRNINNIWTLEANLLKGFDTATAQD